MRSANDERSSDHSCRNTRKENDEDQKVPLGAAAALAAVVLAACSSSSNPSGGSSTPPRRLGQARPAAGSITIGSANFQENVLLMDIYAGALKAKGVRVTTKPNIGARPVYIPALQDGSIDLIPEYTGNLLLYFNKTATAGQLG